MTRWRRSRIAPPGRGSGCRAVLVKIMIVFLLAMVGIAMVGNLLFPGALTRQVKRRLTARRTGACSRCGRPMIGKSCACGKKG